MMFEDRVARNNTRSMLEQQLDELSGKVGFCFSLVDMNQIGQQFDGGKDRPVSILSERELDHFNGLKLYKNRLQWVAGRYAVKAALFKYKIGQKSLMDLSCIDVLKGQDSAPYILQYPWIQCSISHSDPYCIGIVSGKRMGVDIEKVFHPSDALIKFFYSSKEKETLSDCVQSEDYATKSITFWTRKEAVSKFLRQGMRMNFKELDTTNGTIDYDGFIDGIKLHSFICNGFCVSLAW